jgi:hypothetical protein
MLDIAKIQVGDKVCYQPEHYKNIPVTVKDEETGEEIKTLSEKWENGIVKEVPQHTLESVRVVYNCNGDWKNYANYTSALTHIRDLILGWKH